MKGTRIDLQKWSGLEFLMTERRTFVLTPIAARGHGIGFVRSAASQKRMKITEDEQVSQDQFLEKTRKVVAVPASILRLMYYWPKSLNRSQNTISWLDGWVRTGLYDFENPTPFLQQNRITPEAREAFQELRLAIGLHMGLPTSEVKDPGVMTAHDPGAPDPIDDPDSPRDLHAMSDAALLQLIVGAKAKKLLQAAGNLQLLAQWTLPELVNRGGLTIQQARRLHAGLVAGKRGFTEPMSSEWSINSPQDVARFMTQKIGHDRRREHFVVLLVDSSNRLIRYIELSQGTINATLVHPRDVLAAAIQDHAVGIIVGHNHPSGQAVPSLEDKALTNRLGQAAQVVGINLRDHVIVTPDGRFYSFADHGEMPGQIPRAVF